MRCFEFFVAITEVSANGAPYIKDDKLTYGIPDEAQALLEPILTRYGQDPMWYFDGINFGHPPAPWAIICMDKEYSIAGHLATCRPHGSGISFAPYSRIPNPIPQDFVPQVGIITLHNKWKLRNALDRSSLFQILWDILCDCTTSRRWLIVADPLPAEWLALVGPGDRERWLSTR